LNKYIKRYLEEEIRNIEITRREIGEIRNDIIFGGPSGDGGGPSGFHSDITGNKATALTNHLALQRMRRFVDTFDFVYEQLPEEKQKVIELLYWSNRDLSCDGVGMIVGVDGSTVGRWRNAIILRLAKLNGYVTGES
jgi:RinA family phage transcriptional activator